MNWSCPNCSLVLEESSKHWFCSRGHCFDKAKQGYVNLLPVQNKNSKNPGDSKEMIQSRRRFLSHGCYQVLVDHLKEQFVELVAKKDHSKITWLDLGCGEGYYLSQLQSSIPSINWFGVDISKEAIKLAASYSAQFAVASSYRIPIPPNSCDGILQIFSPGLDEELIRILKPKGAFLRVTPGLNHLKELRKTIYARPKQHKKPLAPSGFNLLSNQAVACKFLLAETYLIEDLLQMTPYNWVGDQSAKQKLKDTEEMEITLDFNVQLFEKAVI